ncbi:cell division protein FtsL [Acetatifactor muris]|uniref:cell division protein FtsL n=1 Tax=Acetatifactor muris TaxID=879566 RepID=UPI0023F1EF8F|nr:cell division protein FtsL [Acetatifactor muris]MCI8799822.1 cell division protein FtsL [Lachnospiraceae bacterium]
MSRNRRNYNRTAYDKRNGTDSKRADHIYIYGNTARRLEPQRRQEDPVKKPHHEVRKNRDKARHMSAGYVVFLTVALCAAAYILVNYVQLRAALTNLTEDVASKESMLNYLKVSNDEDYNRIISSIDLEEIKRIALGELGMIYAGEGQIVEYENESRDYMRQVSDENQ